jgi:hypothetical protein
MGPMSALQRTQAVEETLSIAPISGGKLPLEAPGRTKMINFRMITLGSE